MPTKLAVAGLLWVVEDFHIARPGIEHAEPDCIRGQQSLRPLQRGKGAEIDRHQHFLIDGLKKFHDRLPVGHILPFDFPILLFPHELIQERREGLDRLKILLLKRPDESRPILDLGMKKLAHVGTDILFFDVPSVFGEQFRRQIVPQLIAENTIHTPLNQAREMLN